MKINWTLRLNLYGKLVHLKRASESQYSAAGSQRLHYEMLQIQVNCTVFSFFLVILIVIVVTLLLLYDHTVLTHTLVFKS